MLRCRYFAYNDSAGEGLPQEQPPLQLLVERGRPLAPIPGWLFRIYLHKYYSAAHSGALCAELSSGAYTSPENEYAVRFQDSYYLLELIRVLKPDGIFVFQIPDRDKRGVLQRVENYLGLKRHVKRLMRLLIGKRIGTLRI